MVQSTQHLGFQSGGMFVFGGVTSEMCFFLCDPFLLTPSGILQMTFGEILIGFCYGRWTKDPAPPGKFWNVQKNTLCAKKHSVTVNIGLVLFQSQFDGLIFF